jgi:oligoendopeptidase F
LIHQYLSREVGYLNSDTPLTTSETASIFAEMLVFDYIKNDLNRDELISLYAGKLEDIYATLYRQSIFTSFERRVHSKKDELNSDELNTIWFEENQKMFGDSLILSDGYKYWWSYIPHFIHSPFYCYAYSYGQLLVLALYRSYKDSDDKDKFIKKYIKFLSSGGSKSPKDLIGKFGFDIESSDFWQKGIEEIKTILNEFKSEVREDFKERGKLSNSSLDTNKMIDDIIKMTKE